jgi:Cd2+/Zn2+-exporting ATPase
MTTSKKTTFIVAGLDCPNEEKLIRQQFSHNKKIQQMDFNYISEEVDIYHDEQITIEFIQSQFDAINMEAVIKSSRIPQKKLSYDWWPLSVALCLALIAELLSFKFYYLSLILSASSMLIAGPSTFKKGLIAIKTKTLNINALMLVAIMGAICIGQWPEAAMVTVLFAIAEQIERYALEKARHAVRSLMQVAPIQATIITPDQKYQTVNVETVSKGTHVLIKPGERVPLDGIITSGKTRINQAAITGESFPVSKTIGDEVYAGTLNQHGSIEIQATTTAQNTLLAKIAKTIEQAQAQRAPTQRFVDTFARFFTPIMVICALLIAFIPPIFFQQGIIEWIYKALTLLIIACPCALVISTPVCIVSGLANAAHHGILIKGGHFLELGHLLKLIAFDKTGTLTEGKPIISDVISQDDFKYLQIACSLESHSEHPIAQAFINHWQQIQAQENLLPILEFEALPGLGIRGIIDKTAYYLGNHRLAEHLKICDNRIEQQLTELENQGKTTIVLATSAQVLAIFAVSDKLRGDSMDCIRQLHQQGIKVAMLTGDNPLVAGQIANQLKIDQVHASLIPIDKLNAITQFLKDYSLVAMVGDGINDAPALATASISFAMGKGTSTALEIADISLINDRLSLIPYFITLSKKTKQVLMQNISLSILIKLLFFILALTGVATLWMAIFADLGTSLIVVINGLQLIYFKGKRKK